MVHIPAKVQKLPMTRGHDTVDEYLTTIGMQLVRRGKVRDTYRDPARPGILFQVATDRLSIFDFVLPAVVPDKGAILTALTHFMMTHVLTLWPNHLVRSEFKPRLNAAYDYATRFGSSFPLTRTLVVRELEMQPFELIFRAHLGGSVWKTYQESGIVSGRQLPKGMTQWQQLPKPLFTPSTKAVGHDLNITAGEYYRTIGQGSRAAIRKLQEEFSTVYEFAKRRGIVVLDTKFEVSRDWVLADEVFTPDSSRFTRVGDLAVALQEGRSPAFLDKQPVRDWGDTVETPWGTGLRNLDPLNESHLAFVDHLAVPHHVIIETAGRYNRIFERLTGETLRNYQVNALGL